MTRPSVGDVLPVVQRYTTDEGEKVVKRLSFTVTYVRRSGTFQATAPNGQRFDFHADGVLRSDSVRGVARVEVSRVRLRIVEVTVEGDNAAATLGRFLRRVST